MININPKEYDGYNTAKYDSSQKSGKGLYKLDARFLRNIIYDLVSDDDIDQTAPVVSR